MRAFKALLPCFKGNDGGGNGGGGLSRGTVTSGNGNVVRDGSGNPVRGGWTVEAGNDDGNPMAGAGGNPIRGAGGSFMSQVSRNVSRASQNFIESRRESGNDRPLQGPTRDGRTLAERVQPASPAPTGSRDRNSLTQITSRGSAGGTRGRVPAGTAPQSGVVPIEQSLISRAQSAARASSVAPIDPTAPLRTIGGTAEQFREEYERARQLATGLDNYEDLDPGVVDGITRIGLTMSRDPFASETFAHSAGLRPTTDNAPLTDTMDLLGQIYDYENLGNSFVEGVGNLIGGGFGWQEVVGGNSSYLGPDGNPFAVIDLGDRSSMRAQNQVDLLSMEIPMAAISFATGVPVGAGVGIIRGIRDQNPLAVLSGAAGIIPGGELLSAGLGAVQGINSLAGMAGMDAPFGGLTGPGRLPSGALRNSEFANGMTYTFDDAAATFAPMGGTSPSDYGGITSLVEEDTGSRESDGLGGSSIRGADNPAPSAPFGGTQTATTPGFSFPSTTLPAYSNAPTTRSSVSRGSFSSGLTEGGNVIPQGYTGFGGSPVGPRGEYRSRSGGF